MKKGECGKSVPLLSVTNIFMNRQLQSFSPEGLCFAIIAVMSNELSPLIKRLKKWRADNELSQAEAVNVFKEQGLPISLDTLQNWEIGRRSPRGLSAVALSDFLKRHSKITK
jgi:DNA-binding transcriptional regulator YiaG